MKCMCIKKPFFVPARAGAESDCPIPTHVEAWGSLALQI